MPTNLGCKAVHGELRVTISSSRSVAFDSAARGRWARTDSSLSATKNSLNAISFTLHMTTVSPAGLPGHDGGRMRWAVLLMLRTYTPIRGTVLLHVTERGGTRLAPGRHPAGTWAAPAGLGGLKVV